MSNGTDPSQMTPAQRMDEVGMLLSLAMMRLWLKRRAGARRHTSGKRAFSGDSGGNPLGCPAETRLPVTAGKP